MDWKKDHGWDRSVEWNSRNNLRGHREKYIGFDSLRKIEFERDEYNLKNGHDSTKSMSILFRYARGMAKDSIFYQFEEKDSTKTISRHQADSVFAAEKIRKDY